MADLPTVACYLFKQAVDKARQRRFRIAQRLNVRDRVRFASSLATALLDGLSEQPAGQANDARDLRHDSISEVIA
ncbi:hypothetical protein W02_05240 [Nitrospira sp. KM1]|nr:hypothetical protein W02_05240 [Nitrospira sp. KM1]